MIEGKKISELIPANVINDACCFPVLSKGATRKITFAVLLENIINNLQLPETQEIKQLKSEVEKMNTSIELTDKQVESVVSQMNDLQKDVDGQDAVIIKYTKLIEELKEIYEQASITGGVVDSSLNSESINPVQNRVITKLIPAQANEENKLADKDFVNSSIATNTAEFIGTFNSLEELQNTDKSFDNNDYGFVIETDENGNSSYNRYKYNGSEWVFEYTLNNSSFTSEQWAAIQSGITAELVALIGQLDNPIDDNTCDIGHTWSSEKIFNMMKDFCTPRLIDFNNVSETAVSVKYLTKYDFTAEEDCFLALHQSWGGETDASKQCYIFDEQERTLAWGGYSGYGSDVIYSCFCGYVFVPKGKTVKYMFKGNNKVISNPKIIVRTR